MSLKRRVLTVLACGPDQRLSLEDGNTFLLDAHKRLAPVAEREPSAFRLELAQNLLHVRAKVAELAAGPSPLVLQLVGHGRPGELELGRSWPQPGRPSGATMIENHSRLLKLMVPIGVAKPLAEVRLVACNVGAQEGHPLLFSLAHVLDCDVVGALGFVNASMFDARTGLYEGPMTRFVRSRLDFIEPMARPAMAKAAVERSVALPVGMPALTFESMCYARALAHADEPPPRMTLADGEARALKRLLQPIAAAAEGSCVVELAFGVTAVLPDRRSVPGTVEVMSNQRCRLVLAGERVPQPYRWGFAGPSGSAVVQAMLARYEHTWRDSSLAQAS